MVFRDNEASAAIEYGLSGDLIAVAAISALKDLGSQLKTTFTTASSAMAG